MINDHAILAFARDFSGSDPKVMMAVERFVAHPPKENKDIGFYGAKHYPIQSRLFLATVSLLDDCGKLDSVEDKYTCELLIKWRDTGMIDVAALPDAARAVFGPIIEDRLPMDDPQFEAYRDFAWKHYATATQELEQHFASRGKALLSIDATVGDTLFFALVDLKIGERWRDKALAEHEGYRAGVRSPMWDVFWSHLNHALNHVFYKDSGISKIFYPPGVRLRSNKIPFME